MQKKALLIAGAGTLGGYTYIELLKLGWKVDVIALEKLTSLNKNLRFIQARVNDELLKQLFSKNHYDTIVDFIHYTNPLEYRSRCRLLLENTDQLIFLSSYRTYADSPLITEDSPQWLDVTVDKEFLEKEDYGVPKCFNERFLRSCGMDNWTIIRPLISFSRFRLDLVTEQTPTILLRSAQHKPLLMPQGTRYNIGGVGWAGNVGKQIAYLCGNDKAMKEAFTLGMGENLPWNTVAEYYHDLLGLDCEWIPDDLYFEVSKQRDINYKWTLFYDRMLSRRVDTSKIYAATGLAMADMRPTYESIIYELEQIATRPGMVENYMEKGKEAADRMDAWLAQK